MAESTVLKLKFDTMSGSRTWSFKHAKASTTLANIRSLAETMIEEADFFQFQPVKLADARIVTTTEEVYDLDN